MTSSRPLSRSLGADAEARAERYLRDNGYVILDRNFSTQWGEIDIVARDHGKVCFVEVKMRTSAAFGIPALAVSRSKQRRIAMAALVFMKLKRLGDCAARFDVVSMMPEGGGWKIELYRNAFDFPL